MKEEQRQAIVAQVKKRYQVISPHLTEQAKRLWAASEALAIGRGGTTLVAEATGMSRVTITNGKQAVQARVIPEPARMRHRGGGRKPLTNHDPHLLEALNALIDPCTPGLQNRPCDGRVKALIRLQRLFKRKAIVSHSGASMRF